MTKASVAALVLAVAALAIVLGVKLPDGSHSGRIAPPRPATIQDSGAGVDSSDSGPRPKGPPPERPLLRELVGQRLMVRFDGYASPEMVRAVRRGMVGGVIVFPAPGLSNITLRRSIARLQALAHSGGQPLLLVAIDQEGGIVKRLPDGPPRLSAPELGGVNDPALATAGGRSTGRFLRSIGINVDLAPVLDVPGSPSAFIASRSFSEDPATVATIGTAFARGLDESGVAAAAKHFPGLGLAPANTDFATSVVSSSRNELNPGLVPYKQAIRAGVPMVMLSTAIYTALDPAHQAAFSPAAVGLLRRSLGFRGVTISDDLAGRAIRARYPSGQAALSAIRAGTDIALMAHQIPIARTYAKLYTEARRGRLSRSSLSQSLNRIVHLKMALSSGHWPR